MRFDEKKQIFASLKQENLSVFSKTDLECIESVYSKFSDKDQFELAEITHEFPEWIKHKKELDGGKKRVRMDYDDFFVDTPKRDDLFSQNKSDLKMAKESFSKQKKFPLFLPDNHETQWKYCQKSEFHCALNRVQYLIFC